MSCLRTFIQYNSLKFNSLCRRNYWGIISVDFNGVDELLIRYAYFVIVRNSRKHGSTVGHYISSLRNYKEPVFQLRTQCYPESPLR
jgi:hypothetical protein